VEEGTLYPAQRMLVKGWVESEWRQTENKRRARYYKMTAQGREQLRKELREFDRVILAIRRVIQPA
jgi:DNA-binding PadR family transcriptional regulator